MTFTCAPRNDIRLIIALGILLAWCPQGIIADSVFVSQPETTADQAVILVRQVGHLQGQENPSTAEAKELVTKLGEVVKDTKGDLKDALLVYQASAMTLAGQRDEATKLIAGITAEADKPDVLLLRLQLVKSEDLREEGRQRVAISDQLGELFPFSRWGSDRDDRQSPAGKVHVLPPSVPKPVELSDRLVKVGDLYAKAGLLREAVNSYIESIYADSVAKPDPKSAPRWAKIAEWEMAMGQPQLAIRAYLKAAYNDPDSVAASAEGIREVLAGKAPENKPEGQRPKLDAETASAIAALYRESNLHPLALQVLALAQKDTGGDFTTQRTEIEKEWAKIVEIHRQVRGDNCVLLGTKVVDVKDWSEIHINRPSDTFWKPEVAIDVETYFNTLETVRLAWDKSRTGKDVADFAEAASSIEKLSLKADAPGYAVCEYVRCRLLVQAGQKDKAQEEFVKLLESRTCAPEAMLGLLELNRGDDQKRTVLEECMALLLPISKWRTDLDQRASEFLGETDPPRPHIPKVKVSMLTEVAHWFEAAGLYDKAWMAYAEAAYASAPSWIEEKQDKQAWSSSDMALLWQQAAENAWRAGEHSIAFDYLTKAAVFGSNNRLEKVKEILAKWKDDKGEKPGQAPRELQQVALDRIIRLYAAMNLHPRALDVIETYKETLKKPDELRNEYSESWKAIVKAYTRQMLKAILFGVQVTSDVDPVSIKIPPACSTESMKQVKANVAELLKNDSESAPQPGASTPASEGEDSPASDTGGNP